MGWPPCARASTFAAFALLGSAFAAFTFDPTFPDSILVFFPIGSSYLIALPPTKRFRYGRSLDSECRRHGRVFSIMIGTSDSRV
jgi:hypothetical protein